MIDWRRRIKVTLGLDQNLYCIVLYFNSTLKRYFCMGFGTSNFSMNRLMTNFNTQKSTSQLSILNAWISYNLYSHCESKNISAGEFLKISKDFQETVLEQVYYSVWKGDFYVCVLQPTLSNYIVKCVIVVFQCEFQELAQGNFGFFKYGFYDVHKIYFNEWKCTL